MTAIALSTAEYSDQINKLDVRTDPAINVIDVLDLGARVRFAKIDFTAVANIAESVYVRLAKLPRGAKIIAARFVGDTASATTDLQYWLVPKNTLDTGSAVALTAKTDSSAVHDLSLVPVEAQIADDEAYVLVQTFHDTTGTVIALGDTIEGWVQYVI